MSTAITAQSTTDTVGNGKKFVCQEVWGGNRSISAPIELPGICGTLYSKSCDGLRGGDIYYLSVCGSGLLSRFCVADITGHGESVATVSSELHAQMRKSMNRFDQRRVLERLNRRIYNDGFDGFATAISGTYFPPTQMLSISLAGHEPCWWYRSESQTWERLTVSDNGRLSNVALGVDPSVKYTRRRVRVRHGDRILFVTDGVLEASNPSGELFGVERLESCLDRYKRSDREALANRILQQTREHSGLDATSQDDVTLLVLEFVDNIGGSMLGHAIRNRLGIGNLRNTTHSGLDRE